MHSKCKQQSSQTTNATARYTGKTTEKNKKKQFAADKRNKHKTQMYDHSDHFHNSNKQFQSFY